jgi:uncharacterized protein YihD (DUF1040 family)
VRDPNRIPEILSVLSKVWYKNPDFRLCQLIMNATGSIRSYDPYYIEDEELLKKLKELYKEE